MKAPKAPKSITTQKVHAVLRKAGHRRSEFHRSGQVRGWGNSTTGYKIGTFGAEDIRITHYSAEKLRDAMDSDARQARLEEYRATLAAAGIVCVIREDYVSVPKAVTPDVNPERTD